MIWRCVDDNALIYEARRICEHFSIAPTQGLALIKRALNASAGNTLDAQLDLERDLQGMAREMPDYAEGVRAFMEKRKPNFTGRKGDDLMDAATLSRACADAMWADDATSRGLDIELISVEPGRAVLAMVVTETMVNWHNTCHGGFIYLLADTAFGYASNSRNARMVAQHCSITYLNPAQRGDRLTAHADRAPARRPLGPLRRGGDARRRHADRRIPRPCPRHRRNDLCRTASA